MSPTQTTQPMRTHRTLASACALAFGLTLLAAPADAAFVVTTNADAGAGSLRQAILDSNATPGADVIEFALDPNDLVITPLAPLPAVTDAVVLDGTSQPGWPGRPLVELDGSQAGGIGLFVTAGGSTISGLAIGGFSRGIEIGSDGGNQVRGCHIGVNAAGDTAHGNTETGILIHADDNLIGGPADADRNVISANGNGIAVSTGSDVKVHGNYIGTGADGTTAIGNHIGVRALTPEVEIGDADAGEGNVISGNARGVSLESTGASVRGNIIGLAKNGANSLGNSEVGVTVTGGNNTIGGAFAGAGNVISANGMGITIGGPAANDNAILGNLIGMSASGTIRRGNTGTGVRIVSGTDNRIGGTASGAGNVISGSLRGVTLEAEVTRTIVQGNIIGLNAAGTATAQNTETGLKIHGPDNQIGGTAPGAGNVISGNRLYGIVISSPTATGNRIEGNEIGTVVAGGDPLRNGTAGVRLLNAFDNIIGGTDPAASNVISGNGSWGVFADSGTGNRVLGNSFFENGFLAIDLDPYNVNANDAGDGDFGPNESQNYPILESVVAAAGETVIAGQLSSAPNASFRIELFSSKACDPSGFGEAGAFIGATTATTDATGHATIAATLPFEVSNPVVTATATSVDGNTSELSPCAAVGGANPGQLQFTSDPFVGYEYDGTVTIKVSRSHGVSGTVSVDYATADIDATDPNDYLATSGTLTFEPFEVLKTFEVPVVLDAAADHGELIALTLSNPTNGATLGEQSTSELFLGDGDPDLPTVFFSDAQLVEGDAGTTEAVFTISTSPSDVVVTVGYETVDGTATAGSDYQATSGQLIFNPGDDPQTVSVQIEGDVDLEDDEVFFLRITGLTNATVTDGLGEGIILNDDTPTPEPPAPSALCVGGTTINKPKIVLSKLGGPLGDERLTMKGGLVFAPGTPAGLTTLDAADRGAQVRVEDLGSDVTVFDLTAETQPVPRGALAVSECDPRGRKKEGWKTNRKATAYTYVNPLNAFSEAGCTPGSAQGLQRFNLKDQRARKGLVGVNLTARRASIAPPVGPLRVTIVLGADPEAGQTGACAVHEFDAADCQLNRRGTKLVCK